MKFVIVSKMFVEVDLETYNKGKGVDIHEAMASGKIKMSTIPEFTFETEDGIELEDNHFLQEVRKSIYVYEPDGTVTKLVEED